MDIAGTESREGIGGQSNIDLPALLLLTAKSEAGNTILAQPQPIKAKSEPPLVLVADDETIVADTLVEILSEEGFSAVAVHDGASAVESARRLQPDIVLADVAMPRLNGIEAAKRIREFLPTVRIVLFSGHVETAELLLRAEQEGHTFQVLAKPVSPVALLKVLKTNQ